MKIWPVSDYQIIMAIHKKRLDKHALIWGLFTKDFYIFRQIYNLSLSN